MTVQCPTCNTRYRFDKDSIKDKRIRLRCTRCGTVFSYGTEAKPSAQPPEPSPIAREEDFRKIAELIDNINRPDEGLSDTNRSYINEKVEKISDKSDGEVRKNRRAFKKVLLVILCLVVIAYGFILWRSPALRTSIITSIETMVGLNETKEPLSQPEKNIIFTDVRESFHMNWIDGHVLVIEGTMVNKNPFGLTRIKIRGTLLDGSKNIIDQRESFCGNILTEEELRNLNGEEINVKLLNPAGHEGVLEPVPPGGEIPFMLVFARPAKEAGEFIVEPAEIVSMKTP